MNGHRERPQPVTSPGRGRYLVAIVALVVPMLAAGACLAPPVEEKVDLFLLPEGTVVSCSVAVRNSPDVKNNELAAERLDQLRAALVAGEDPWAARFARLEALADRQIVDRLDGQVGEVRRLALLRESEDLVRFFHDTPLRVEWAANDEWTELSISPGQPDRATGQQARMFRQKLQAWSEGTSIYVKRLGALWDYLDEHPDRARAALAPLLPGKDRGEPEDGEPSEEEAALVDAVQDALGGLAVFFQIEEDEAWSASELASIVRDPFPAPMRIRFAGNLVLLDGFDRLGEDAVGVPPLDLGEAVRRLEGQWISPDPLVALLDSPNTHDEFDVPAFARRPRTLSHVPSPSEVREATEAVLTRAPLYRLRFEPAPRNPEAPELTYDDPRLRF